MKNRIGIICILLLSIFSIRSLFFPGYFPMHDDTQVARVIVMGKALKQGQFPVRWVSDLGYGYGYPIYNFYGPLPYYVGGGLYAAGVDSVLATKIMFMIGIVIAPISLFILVNAMFGFLPAVTASMLFLYAPYHAVEIYVRGAVGEYWAIAFFPLLIYGLIETCSNKEAKKGILIGGIAFGAIVVSHTILGFITSGILGIGLLVYLLFLFVKRKLTISRILYPSMLIVIGLGVSAFFWLPAIVEMSATSVGQMINDAKTTFFDHFVCIGQLWNSPWGFAGSAPGCIDGMSFKYGKVQVGMFFVSFITWLWVQKNKKKAKKNTFMLWTIVGFTISTYLILGISALVWRYIPFVNFIQYPWRLLSFGMMFLAIGGVYGISVIRVPVVRLMLAIGVIGLTIGVNSKLFTPQYVYNRDSKAFETVEELRFIKSKISDEYLPVGIDKPQQVSDVFNTVIRGEAAFSVKRIEESDTRMRIELESSNSQTISFRKAWFPGWTMTINGKKTTPHISAGIPFVEIPAGKSIIQMKFVNTPIRVIGNIISVCTIVLIGVLYANRKKTNN